MEGLNTTLSVLAIIASLVIVGYLVFVRRKVGELQYRWETGTWPHSGSSVIDSLNRWEADHDVLDLDSEIAKTDMEIAQASEDYRRKRENLGALSVTREIISQLEKRQKALFQRRTRKAWLAEIVGSQATASTGPPKPPDDNQPGNGKVNEPKGLVVASKS